MSRPRRAVIPTVVLLALLVVAAPVAAKTGYEARLDTPISRDARAGTILTVGFQVYQVAGVERLPLESPGPVFLRLYPMTRGATPTEALGVRQPATSAHFAADIEVPAGGIARVEVGLRNESCVGGVCTRSDMLFDLTDDVLVAGPGTGAPLDPAAAEDAADGRPGSVVAWLGRAIGILAGWVARLASD